MMLAFTVEFDDHCTLHDEENPIKTMQTRYLDILTRLSEDFGSRGWTDMANDEIETEI